MARAEQRGKWGGGLRVRANMNDFESHHPDHHHLSYIHYCIIVSSVRER